MEHIPAPYQTYPGGKSGEGVYQTVINEVPPIKVLVSLFAGNAGIERRIDMKGGLVVLNDIDEEVYRRYCEIERYPPNGVLMAPYNFDGLELLTQYLHKKDKRPGQTLIFADPPYLFESRSSQRDIYNHEWDYEKHVLFLKRVKEVSARGYKMAITHPMHILYASQLENWRTVDFESMTRAGTKFRDTLWLNYPPPEALQDYRYWGGDYRKRENFKRLIKRNVKRVLEMPPIERNCLIERLNQIK